MDPGSRTVLDRLLYNYVKIGIKLGGLSKSRLYLTEPKELSAISAETAAETAACLRLR